MRLDLQSLRLFVVVAKLRSIAAAAEKEFIAASAVSKRIADLELMLDTKLFYRMRRGVELTPAGFALLHHATSILQSVEQLGMELTEYSQGVRGHVRVLANISAITQFLPDDLGTFVQQYPEIKIDLKEDSTPHIIKCVASGLADVGIIAPSQTPKDVKSEPYRSDALALIVPHGHPLAKRRTVRFVEALDFDFVGLHQDSGWQLYLGEVARDVEKPIRFRIRVPSFDAVFGMVKANLGVSVVPLGTLKEAARAMGLHVIELDETWSHRTLRMCYRDLDTLPITARILVDHLRARYLAAEVTGAGAAGAAG
jgi:DNA-binding transcriptional LysR family regulator